MGLFSSIGKTFNKILGADSAMKQQNAEQWNMWNAQNAYNTPVAQMERLKKAGLNPMLVYGSGSVAGNTSSSMSAASGQASGAASILGEGMKGLGYWLTGRLNQDLQLGQEQIEQVKANTSFAQANARKVNAEADRIESTPKWVVPGDKSAVANFSRYLAQFDYDSKRVKDSRLPALGPNYDGVEGQKGYYGKKRKGGSWNMFWPGNWL